MPKPKILVVDDEPSIVKLLEAYLKPEGYEVFTAADGPSGLKAAQAFKPDLIILDIMLPGMDGIELLTRLRRESEAYVILLTARTEETDRIVGLTVGADDYVTKPFGMGELLARMRAALRRGTAPAGEPVFTVGQLIVDLGRRVVTMAGGEVQLTPKEYELLRMLVTHAGKVLTHRQLLRQVWGVAYQTETHLLRVNMSNLRHKLEPDAARPNYILTEPGVGYRLRVNE